VRESVTAERDEYGDGSSVGPKTVFRTQNRDKNREAADLWDDFGIT